MDDYAGRVLADRYRLPAAVDAEPIHTRAFDTYSGQDVLIGQVPLPEVVEAELIEEDGGADPAGHGGGGAGRGGAASAVQRAMDAARAAAAIPDHPRLAQVFDVFEEGGSLWIVSELVPARTLEGLLAERPLSPYRGAEVAADILTALRALHAHGWTHRNITTRTVLVCDDGRVVLTGLASGAAEEALCGYDPLPPPPGRSEPPRPTGSPGPPPGAAPQAPGGPSVGGEPYGDPADGRLPQLPDPATGFLPAQHAQQEAGRPDAGVLPPGWDDDPGPYGPYGDGDGGGAVDGADARGGAGPYGTPPYDEDDEVWRSAPYGAGGGPAGGRGAQGARGGPGYGDAPGAAGPDDESADEWPFGAWQRGGSGAGEPGGPGGPGGPGAGAAAGRRPGPAEPGGAQGQRPQGGRPAGAPGGQQAGGARGGPPPGAQQAGAAHGTPGSGAGGPGAPGGRGAGQRPYVGRQQGGQRPPGGMRDGGPGYGNPAPEAARRPAGQAPGGEQSGDPLPAARAGVMAAYQAGTRAAEARIAAGSGGAGGGAGGGGAAGAGPQSPGRPAVPGQSARTPAAGPRAGAAGPAYSDRIDIGGNRAAPGDGADPPPQAAGSPDAGAPWDDLPHDVDGDGDGYDEYGTADAYGSARGGGPGAGGSGAYRSAGTQGPGVPGGAVGGGSGGYQGAGAAGGSGVPGGAPGPGRPGGGPPVPGGAVGGGAGGYQGAGAAGGPGGARGAGPGAYGGPGAPGGAAGGGSGAYQGAGAPGGSGVPGGVRGAGPGAYGGPGGAPASGGDRGPGRPGGARPPGAYGGPGPSGGGPGAPGPGGTSASGGSHAPGGHGGPGHGGSSAPGAYRGSGAYPGAGQPRAPHGTPAAPPFADPEPEPHFLPGGAAYGGSLPGVRPGASIAVPVGAQTVPAPRGEQPGTEAGGATRYPGPGTRLAAERARQTRMQVVGAVTERWAPEQAGPVHEHWQLAPPVGPAADLWALGALLFRAVQGHPAYPEEDVAELVQLVCAEPAAHAEECGALRPVVESLLRQDPTERPDFEELRGWLRSLIRTAPEPGIGSRTVTVPQQGTGRGGDPRRLPILRRRGELMRRRRAGKAPVPVHAKHRRRRSRRGPRGPRSLGRTLIALIFVAMAGAIAYAAMFMPQAEEGTGNQRGVVGAGQGDEPGESAAPTGDGSGQDEPEERRQPKESDDPGKPDNGERNGGASGGADGGADSALPDGFTLREDPAGFEVAVREDWQRVGGSDGQVRYVGGDYELVVVPGRDGVGEFGSDPMAYQQQSEPELDPYRDAAWAQAEGLRQIEVGQRVMAEGEFDWTESGGQQIHARNLAMIWDDSYHVVLLIGPDGKDAEVERFHRIAAESYRPTK
ncbi:protein kinase [Streptomyces sp. MAR4 CNX-425]|uniref:protein kinase n=1 Tax=Streptomyces sp. MAR4 CNX-425 TaxID=3406343 RepID=UPI003B50909A